MSAGSTERGLSEPSAILDAARMRHAEQLQRVETAQDQLAAAHGKLAQIERELAQLVAQQTPMPTAATAATADGAAPPTTTLILNPAAKIFLEGYHRPETVVAALEAVGISAELALTTPAIDAYQLAKQAVADGATLIIAAGGDGTIEEVAAALVDTTITLGILPLGTMNNIARVLGLPLDLTSAVRVLAMGAVRHIDVGHVLTPDGSIDGYFLETAGLGLSAIAAPMGEAVEKGRWGDVFNKLGEFLAGSATQVTIRCDDAVVFEAQTHTVTIANAPLFGNNMLIAPNAKVDDGLLDLAIYDGMELVDLTAYFYAISGGGRTADPRIVTHRAARIHISTAVPLAVNADLDVLDKQQTWEIAVKPRALAVVVGNGVGLTFPVTAAPAPPPLAGPQVVNAR